MVLRLFVHTDDTQSLFLAFDLYIILFPYNRHRMIRIQSRLWLPIA